MVDTVVLTLPLEKVILMNPDKFTPSARHLTSNEFGGRGYNQAVQNPTRQELREGNYKPRLTLTKRVTNQGIRIFLKIEFSAAKMVFGNNFDELSDSDFDRLITRLRLKLREMGVEVLSTHLQQATVSVIHYAKNIAFTDYTSCTMLISELHKVDLTKRLDISHTTFRNTGHALHYHANSFEVVFYDKLKDLEQAGISNKRAIENDNEVQLSLFDNLTKEKPLDVLRMEIRLGSKQKIAQSLKKLGLEPEPTFQQIFKQAIAQAVLLSFWKDVQDNMIPLAMHSARPIDLLSAILKSDSKIKLTKALSFVGSLMIIGNKNVGFRGFQESVERHFTNSTWKRLVKELKMLNLSGYTRYQALNQITASLNAFEPLSLKQFDIQYDYG